MQRNPLKPISDRRRRQLAALGITNPTSTFLPKTVAAVPNGRPPAPRVGTPSRAARRSTGPDKLTVETVWLRDGGRCAWCGLHISGERSRDWPVSHRRPRRMGGDHRPDTNSPANLVLVHGDGVSLCHGTIERERVRALAAGHILHDLAVPSHMPIVHAVFDGLVYLTDDGGVSVRPPRRSA